MRNTFLALAALLIVGVAGAQTVTIVGTGQKDVLMANESGLAVNKTYSVDMSGIGNLASMQVLIGSGTFSNVTLTDGKQSTGTISVMDNTTISTATATGSFTVNGVAALTTSYITLGSYHLRQGTEWFTGATALATAISISTAITRQFQQLTTVVGSNAVITITSPASSVWNGLALASTSNNITASGAYLTGGRSWPVLTINGTMLTYSPTASAGHYIKGATGAATATAIAAGINATPALSAIMSAVASSTDVAVTSLLNGTASNVSWSSNNTRITVTNTGLYGGANASFKLNAGEFNATAHGLTLGMPVVYHANSAAIGGLTDTNTYYVIPGSNVNTLRLATSRALAQAGTYITVTSTTSQTTANAPTLSTTSITGSVTINIEGSNDNTNWTVITSSAPGYYKYPYAVWTYDIGAFDYRYLGLGVTAPTAGGLYLKANSHVVNTPH